jgi:hypothetical protein
VRTGHGINREIISVRDPWCFRISKQYIQRFLRSFSGAMRRIASGCSREGRADESGRGCHAGFIVYFNLFSVKTITYERDKIEREDLRKENAKFWKQLRQSLDKIKPGSHRCRQAATLANLGEGLRKNTKHKSATNRRLQFRVEGKRACGNDPYYS